MKELKAYGMNDPKVGDEYEMYKVSEVDAVLAEKDAKIHELENMPHTDNSAVIDALETENEAIKKELAELREATRWRNVDDKFPTADDGYFFVLWEDGLPDVGYIGAEDDVIETVRDRGEGHSVEYWMPQPPKEGK